MKFGKLLGLLLALTGLFQFAPSTFGFALLGPFAPWMEETNGFRQGSMLAPGNSWQPSDIGGPMRLDSEYRWNVPIVTYGFDRSFLDYFGANGVAAVEDAIQTLNDLPAASDLILTNYPLDCRGADYVAQVQGLYDLKSVTLSLLLEQMGLAQPARYTYALKGWDPTLVTYHPQFGWFFVEFDAFLETNRFSFTEYDPYGLDPGHNVAQFLIARNFDPETLAVTEYVNGIPYNAMVYSYPPGNNGHSTGVNGTITFFGSFFYWEDNVYSALADFRPCPGIFYTSLSRDDVGGLRYLLSADNVNYEQLLPDVRTFVPLHDRRGTEAWRPGVEKITFVRQPSGGWSHWEGPSQWSRPLRYRFTDFYFRNNVLKQQLAERMVREPDLLFCAADTGKNDQGTQWVVRPGTTNWLNNAFWNGNTNGEGPGVIRPPIKITFHKLGALVITDNSGDPGVIYNQAWGSFDGSTNLPIIYPHRIQSSNEPLIIHFSFFDTAGLVTNRTWNLRVPVGGQALLQFSTNQVDWTSLVTITNLGAVVQWVHNNTEYPPKFFRVIPQ